LVPKKNQRRELIEQAGGLDGGRDQDEERGEQSNLRFTTLNSS
jgi:hypothetical protein